MTWDATVGIVGAGPAGARAAELLAQQGVDVLLLDHKAPWEKPCGGGLTPSLFDEVPELDSLKAGARSVSHVRVEVSPDRGLAVPLDEPVWIVSRLTLAKWQLARATTAGARHLRLKVIEARRHAEGWCLKTDSGEIRVAFLIGADGGASLVRRVAAPKARVELAPTRVAYPRSAGPHPDRMVLKFYEGLAGYLWDFPRSDHRSIGVGVPSGTWRRPQLDAEIDQYRESNEPCACSGLERAGAVIGTAQLGHGDYSKIVGDDYALLGDAAGLADPLTGEGIQNAIRSADLFVDAWAAGDPKSYARRARRAFDREFRVARLLRRFVFETEAGTRLVSAAISSNVYYGVVAAITNALNEHDGRPVAFLRRWVRGWREARSEPDSAGREPRVAVPCACEAGRAGDREAVLR
jgi:flavin-dependent dehydrogenase